MTTTLRPQLAELQKQANELRNRATRLQKLTVDQLNWSPAPERWSIARILDHLNKTHALCVPKFEQALSGAGDAGSEREETLKHRFSDRVFLQFMKGDGPFKVPVPPIFEPDSSPDPKVAVRRFFELHDAMVRVVEKSDNHKIADQRVSSPVSEKMKIGYFAYLTGMLMHEEYHWGQVEALLTDPAFPK